MKLVQALRNIIISAIKFYQSYLSPLLPPSCRFYPSCSEYSLQAFSRYGPLKASYLTLIRIMKCHPFTKGGYDPLN
ncbi:MAG: membrane protein insertion efficiency factor YidD [Candidatus Aminicenantales bacterium]